jgi:hypothetical protein
LQAKLGQSPDTQGLPRHPLSINFNEIRLNHDSPLPVQTKLTIGQPNDKYEQEADRVAGQVMSMPAPTPQQQVQRMGTEEEIQAKPESTPLIQRQGEDEEELQAKHESTPMIQRMRAEEEEELQAQRESAPAIQRMGSEDEEELQTKPENALLIQRMGMDEKEELQAKPESTPTLQPQANEEEELQAKSTDQTATIAPASTSQGLESRLAASTGGGTPLSPEVRTFMEPRFGVDFSQVRIHTSSEAVQMNRDLQAQAFTHGSDIYFGSGKYDPGSSAGKQLLAHELTHVVQQTGGVQLKRIPGFEIKTLPNVPHSNLFRKKAPSAVESVGGTPGTVTFVPGALGSGSMSALAPGERGYTSQLLPMIPEAAGETIAYYKDAHLTPVTEPTFKWHNQEILRFGLAKRKAEQEVSGWSPKSINELWETRAKGYEKLAEKMAAEIYTIQTLCRSFNAWAPRANMTFISLARLEGLQELLGVKDPSAMVTAVTEGLKQAQLVAERAKISSPGSLDVPEADRQVASSVEATTMAASKMRTAWLGFQQTLAQKNIEKFKKAGEADEKRLKEINEVIEFCSNVGKTIDLALTVLEGGGKLMAASSGAEAQKAATDVGKSVAKGVGIDIPSDAAGLLKGIAKLAYLKEIEKIETKLAVLKTGIEAHKAAADELGVTQKISAFEVAVADYKRESQEMNKRLIARQLAYVKLGEQLDEAARKDPTAVAKGIAPGKGKERFATIMLMTSAAREVLAMGNGAKAGFSDPGSLRSQISRFEVIQDSPSGKVPASELDPLISIYKQTAAFHSNVNELTNTLGPIDQQAAAMMQALSGGAEVAGAY